MVQARPLRARSLGITTASVVVSMTSQMLWWASPAQSQSFLQQLFGLSPPPAPHARPLPPRGPVGGAAPGVYLPGPRPDLANEQPRLGSRALPKEGTGSFTTVCVRLCDGFYFPITHRASRGRFQHDAEMCRSRCGQTEARLFYHPSAGGSMSNAVDLNGRSYTRLKTAFMHRKQLVAGCTCKPAPWSAASIMRYQMYALNDGLDINGARLGIGTVAVVAGQYPDAPPAAPATDKTTTPTTSEMAATATTSGTTAVQEGAVAPTSAATAHPPVQVAPVKIAEEPPRRSAPASARRNR
jgi:hypothetical protein